MAIYRNDPYENKTDIQVFNEITNKFLSNPDVYDNNGYEYGVESIVNYYPSDTYQSFKKNKKVYKDELDVYEKHPLYYTINRQGFRSDIVDYNFLYDQEVDIILGCSFTFGIGFHIEHTWPRILENLIGGKKVHMVNLALPGTGGDTSYRLLLTYLNKFKKIRRIIHQQPFYARFEIISDDKVHNFHASEVELSPTVKQHFTKLHRQCSLVNRRVHMINHIRNITACKGLAEINDIPYYFLPYGHSIDPNNVYEIYARDIDHGGFTGQFNVAYTFAKKIKENDQRIDLTCYGADHYGNSGNTGESKDKFPKKSFINYIESIQEVSKFYPNAYYSRKVI